MTFLVPISSLTMFKKSIVIISGSCETYEQEKIVCHYHDCVRGTIAKPDYRLVDDKLYFDCTMKHMDDEENEDDSENEDSDVIKNGDEIQDGGKKKKKQRKTTAMVINHHIYF